MALLLRITGGGRSGCVAARASDTHQLFARVLFAVRRIADGTTSNTKKKKKKKNPASLFFFFFFFFEKGITCY